MATIDWVDEKSFAYRDITDQDRWESFTPSFTSLEASGTTSYSGRLRIVGASLQFQATLRASTAIRSSAGEAFMVLPITAQGLSGIATMTNDTSNVAAGTCHIDVATSRAYLPTLVASANTFTVAGWFEIG